MTLVYHAVAVAWLVVVGHVHATGWSLKKAPSTAGEPLLNDSSVSDSDSSVSVAKQEDLYFDSICGALSEMQPESALSLFRNVSKPHLRGFMISFSKWLNDYKLDGPENWPPEPKYVVDNLIRRLMGESPRGSALYQPSSGASSSSSSISSESLSSESSADSSFKDLLRRARLFFRRSQLDNPLLLELRPHLAVLAEYPLPYNVVLALLRNPNLYTSSSKLLAVEVLNVMLTSTSPSVGMSPIVIVMRQWLLERASMTTLFKEFFCATDAETEPWKDLIPIVKQAPVEMRAAARFLLRPNTDADKILGGAASGQYEPVLATGTVHSRETVAELIALITRICMVPNRARLGLNLAVLALRDLGLRMEKTMPDYQEQLSKIGLCCTLDGSATGAQFIGQISVAMAQHALKLDPPTQPGSEAEFVEFFRRGLMPALSRWDMSTFLPDMLQYQDLLGPVIKAVQYAIMARKSLLCHDLDVARLAMVGYVLPNILRLGLYHTNGQEHLTSASLLHKHQKHAENSDLARNLAALLRAYEYRIARLEAGNCQLYRLSKLWARFQMAIGC